MGPEGWGQIFAHFSLSSFHFCSFSLSFSGCLLIEFLVVFSKAGGLNVWALGQAKKISWFLTWANPPLPSSLPWQVPWRPKPWHQPECPAASSNARLRGQGFTRQPKNSKRAHFRLLALQTPLKFHEQKTTQSSHPSGPRTSMFFSHLVVLFRKKKDQKIETAILAKVGQIRMAKVGIR